MEEKMTIEALKAGFRWERLIVQRHISPFEEIRLSNKFSWPFFLRKNLA